MIKLDLYDFKIPSTTRHSTFKKKSSWFSPILLTQSSWELKEVLEAYINGSFFQTKSSTEVRLYDLICTFKYTWFWDRRYVVNAKWWWEWCDYVNLDFSTIIPVDLKTCKVDSSWLPTNNDHYPQPSKIINKSLLDPN